MKKIILSLMFVLTASVLLGGDNKKVDKKVDKWIGVTFMPISDDLQSYLGEKAELIVMSIVKDNPADKSGLKPGDVVLTVNKKPVVTVFDIIDEINKNENITLSIIRKGKKEELKITPIKRPDNWWDVPMIGGNEIDKSMYKFNVDDFRRKFYGLPTLHLDNYMPAPQDIINTFCGRENVNEWGTLDYSHVGDNKKFGVKYIVTVCSHNYSPRSIEFFKITLTGILIDHEVKIFSFPDTTKIIKIPNRERPNSVLGSTYLVGITGIPPNTTTPITIDILGKKVYQKQELEKAESFYKGIVKEQNSSSRNIIFEITPIEPPKQYLKMMTEME